MYKVNLARMFVYVYSYDQKSYIVQINQCVHHLYTALQALCAVIAELKAVKLNVSVSTRLSFLVICQIRDLSSLKYPLG